MLTIRTNIMAMNAHRMANRASLQMAQAMRRLSTGLRINSAADDAAGLAISENMRAQIRGMQQAAQNTRQGIDMLQTVEGFVSSIGEMMHRINELTVQAANDTNDHQQREYIFNEIEHLMSEIERIIGTSTFNGQNIFGSGGLLGGTFNLQVGANPGDSIGLNLNQPVANLRTRMEDLRNAIDGVVAGGLTHADISGLLGPNGAIAQAQTSVNSLRAHTGAYINRLEFTIQNLEVSIENLMAAESRIRDADMAKEMMNLIQATMLRDIAMFMMAQAMRSQNMILRLLESMNFSNNNRRNSWGWNNTRRFGFF